MTHLEPFQNKSEFNSMKDNIDMKCQDLEPVSAADGTHGHGAVGFCDFPRCL